MDRVGKLLGKYASFELPEGALRQEVIDVVYDVVGVRLSQSEVQVRRGVAYIRAHPTVKSELLIAGREILTHLTQRGARISAIR